MAFLKTDHGWLNEQHIVKIFRPTVKDFQPDYYEVIYFDGGEETQVARASVYDAELLLGIGMPPFA